MTPWFWFFENKVKIKKQLVFKIINGFEIKIMYVYYIAMKIYVLVFINVFSPFYCLCIINMTHHFPTMDFTTFQNKNLNFFHNFIPRSFTFISQFIFIKWRCFQRSQTPTYILTKRKLNKKFFKPTHHIIKW
jgi:hypothetical protein